MNENELNSNSSGRETYHATTNLNIDIENPQINIDSVVGVNIRDGYNSYTADDSFSSMEHESFTSLDPNVGNSNLSNVQNNAQTISNSFQNDYYNNMNSSVGIDSNFSDKENQFVPTMESNTPPSDVNSSNNNRVEKPVYEPTLEEKKQKGQGLSASSKELKITIFIVFILFIFILLMPYVYDFFENLQLALTR